MKTWLIYDAATGEGLYTTVSDVDDVEHHGPGQDQVEVPAGTDASRAWVDVETQVVMPYTPPPPPDPTLEEQQEAAKAELEAVAAEKKYGGVDVVITYAQATVPLDTYWARTDDAAFSQLAVIQQRLLNLPSGDTAILETADGQLLDVDLDTFGFFYLRAFNHHQWSDAARRDVRAQIDMAGDPAALDVQALYDAAYEAAKPVGEY